MNNILGKILQSFLLINLHPWNNLGSILFVGEGNLSFSKSIAMNPLIKVNKMISTTYENKGSLSKETIKNANFLKLKGAKVKHGVDAKRLEENFQEKFDTIVFQFPNVGSREPKYGQNPNHIMIRKFLNETTSMLLENGKVLITVVDSPYYKGAFKFDNIEGYQKPAVFPFVSQQFIGYNHVNTNDDDSALEGHRRFVTYVFRPKK